MPHYIRIFIASVLISQVIHSNTYRVEVTKGNALRISTKGPSHSSTKPGQPWPPPEKNPEDVFKQESVSLGRGTFAEVFKRVLLKPMGKTGKEGDTVAVKELRMGDRDQFIKDELACFDIIAHIDGAIHKIGHFQHKGTLYIVMDFVEGGDLTSYGQMDENTIIFYITKLLQFVGNMHDAGLVHRDIKPANIFLTAEGELKVLDYGGAKSLALEGQKLEQHERLFTLIYASETQMLGTFSKNSDYWSVGVTAFWMRFHTLFDHNRHFIMYYASGLPWPEDQVVGDKLKDLINGLVGENRADFAKKWLQKNGHDALRLPKKLPAIQETKQPQETSPEVPSEVGIQELAQSFINHATLPRNLTLRPGSAQSFIDEAALERNRKAFLAEVRMSNQNGSATPISSGDAPLAELVQLYQEVLGETPEGTMPAGAPKATGPLRQRSRLNTTLNPFQAAPKSVKAGRSSSVAALPPVPVNRQARPESTGNGAVSLPPVGASRPGAVWRVVNGSRTPDLRVVGKNPTRGGDPSRGSRVPRDSSLQTVGRLAAQPHKS